MGEKRGMQALEAWCRKITAGYQNVNITNMTSSWRNGLGFCAIIHHFRPDLIDFDSLSPEDVYKNNELAFSTAEQHLGIPALLDPEDMVEYQVPDRLSILTYLSQLYKAFAAQGNKDGSPRTPIKRPVQDLPPQATPTGPTEKKIFARNLQPPSRRNDTCNICKNPVFLAERLILDRKLFHRTCFRCARCKAQLSIADCYETEQGQFCCETCPDEERTEPDSTARESPQTQIAESRDSEPRHVNRLAELKAKFEMVASKNQAAANFIRGSLLDEGPKRIPESPKVLPETSTRISPERKKPPEEKVRVPAVPDEVAKPTPKPRGNIPVITEPVPESTVSSEHLDKDLAEEVNGANTEVPGRAETLPPVPDPSPSVSAENELPESTAVSSPCDPESVSPPAGLENSTGQPEDVPAQPERHPGSPAEPETVPVHVVEPTELSVPDVTDSSKPPEVVPEPCQDLPEFLVKEHAPEGLTGTTPAAVKTEKDVMEHSPNPFEDDDDDDTVQDDNVVEPANQSQTSLDIPKAPTRKKRHSGEPIPVKTEPNDPIRVKEEVNQPTSVEYPDDLNPFADEDLTGEESNKHTAHVSVLSNPFDSAEEDDVLPPEACVKRVLRAPRLSLNPFESDDDDDEEEDDGITTRSPPPPRPPPPSTLTRHHSPSPKKRPAPPPPSSGSTTSPSSPMTTLHRRKDRPAPPPPQLVPSPAPEAPVPSERKLIPCFPLVLPRHSVDSNSSACKDSALHEKTAKDLSNLSRQNKDQHGQWKRKKAPAPPRPLPQKRQLRKLPIKVIQQELEDIEVKQQELERQGVILEQSIRDVTESENATASAEVEVEELILQLFDLVNLKNELLRRQTELMYLKRQQRLEEEHAELEYQIRCLMEKPEAEKTDEDRLREEELIQRLVETVHRRAEVIDCLEMDRRREAEEDRSIQHHLEVYNHKQEEEQASPKSKSKTLNVIGVSPLKLVKKKKKEKDKSKTADDSTTEAKNTSGGGGGGEKDKKKSKWFGK